VMGWQLSVGAELGKKLVVGNELIVGVGDEGAAVGNAESNVYEAASSSNVHDPHDPPAPPLCV